jgi:hypothetical protein
MLGIESVPDIDAVIKRLVDGLPTPDLTSVLKTEIDGETDVAKVLLPVEKTLRVEVLRRTLRLNRLVISEEGREIAKLEVRKEIEGTNVGITFEAAAADAVGAAADASITLASQA